MGRHIVPIRSGKSGGQIPSTIKIDNDNDKKELEKIIENKEANNKLIDKVKSINIKPKKKKYVNLEI